MKFKVSMTLILERLLMLIRIGFIRYEFFGTTDALGTLLCLDRVNMNITLIKTANHQ